MNLFENGLRRYLNEAQLEKIQQTSVGIAGAGGLGSNCAIMLVRSGFKKITLVDFDEVDVSNLNRQNYFTKQVGTSKVSALADILRAINPDLHLTIVNDKITEKNIHDIFFSCDIIIEALDTPEGKTLMVETMAETKKLLVTVSGLAGFGNSDRIKTRKINAHFYVIGDLESGIDRLPPLAPGVTIAAAKQVDLVLEFVLSKG
ncbi:sulfur carrier protein ThiS adenylyltransferase ThiF [Anaerosinus massiliensis]|uniref:sulfur carrier protein ThiS adenylyltransferase ThiF n=1 Tax=Massilibacillus massiliensis TaxID=1806837 RepID=UPI000B224541|nr:sulfur carrier protein ThiS adenylyltransferase ThiF [Massilibacillus massiliensis]